MTKMEVEVFSTTTNAAVIRVPGRQFPGLAIQGDSLKILFDCAQEILRESQSSGSADLIESTVEMKEILAGYLEAYESALKAHGH